MENYLKVASPMFLELHRLGGGTPTLCDGNGNRLFHAFGGAEACRLMRMDKNLCEHCVECDRKAFEALLNGRKRHSYVCDAGLSETVVAIRSEKQFKGYLIYGKVRVEKDREESESKFQSLLSEVPKEKREVFRSAFSKIPVINEDRTRDVSLFLEKIVQNILSIKLLDGFRDRDILDTMTAVGTREKTKLTLKELLRDLGVTRRVLLEKFMKCCGVSPFDFIRHRVLIRAEDRLMNTGDSVDAISELLGYDLCAFTSFFKRYCFVTPGKFRMFASKEEDMIAREENARRRIGIAPF